jgi:Flp pilus assembly protein TadD
VVGRARAWRALGAGERGTALLDQALASQPNDAMLRLWRGRYRLEAPDCPGALADFVQVAALAPDDPMAHASLGLARACLGDATGARAALARSLQLDPNQPEVREFLASIPNSP